MYKSKLQEFCHKNSWNLPFYATAKDGPDHCPRFTTTVTVNGILFQSPDNEAKSSKESQNVAAKLAFDYLSDTSVIVDQHHSLLQSRPVSPPSPSVPSPLRASSNNVVIGPAKNEVLQQNHVVIGHAKNEVLQQNHVVIGPAKNEILQQNHGGNMQTTIANDMSLHHKDDSKPIELLHLYKNRLQHHAQKNNLSFPTYSCEFDGPPHARQFRATVMIDGRSYPSTEYYSTLKDAEHAAAKSALESLSVVEIQENEGLFKTLLQELTQKEGFRFPSYSTIKSGPPHMPAFVSTVEVSGEIYQGVECKTKKQSEMSAAKVAYDKLVDRIAVSNCTPLTTSSLQPISSVNRHIGAKMTPENHLKRASGEVDRQSSILSLGSDKKVLLELSSPSSGSVVTNALVQTIQPQLAHKVDENPNAKVEGAESNAKRYRCSENMFHHLPEAFPPSSAFSNAPSSFSMPSELVKSDKPSPAGGSLPPGTKIRIFRRGSNMEIPEGACILPHYDDKWVAVRVEANEDQQV